jgi:predicted Rossmann fold nucleotide-binding protein DprA/Smf involved in DNA uptake
LAVVGGGVDVVYPRENRRLWDEVLATGGIISEAPPGAPPESWRFPLRNRIIAALSQVLVVVESSRQGGAIHTVLAADAYGVPILAVPGSVRSPQSEGTNAIIQEGGAGVVLDVHDVLAVLALACQEDGTPISFAAARSGHDPRRRVSTSWKLAWGRPPGGEPSQPPPRPSSRPASDDRSNRDGRNNQEAMDFERPIPTPASPMSRREEARRRAVTGCSPTEQAVLEAVDYTATLIDLVCRRTKLDLGVVALAIDRLEEVGLVRTDGAAWIRA